MSLWSSRDLAPFSVPFLSWALAGLRSSPPPSSVSPHPPPLSPHGSAPSLVERASSCGRWCAGPTPAVWGSVRGTSRTRSRSAACPPAEVSRVGWGGQPSSSGLDLRPSLAGFPAQILELLFPLTGNLQNSTVRADVRELVTAEGEWMPQSGPLDPINKISSSKCISGPHPLPSLPVFTASWAWAVQWSGPRFQSVHVTLASWSLGFLSCEVGMMLILVHDSLSAVPKY